MNLSETARLLAAIAAFNNRTIGAADVGAWQSVLGDIELADAMEAVRRHYTESTEWLMPAHVRRLIGEIVKARETSPWAPGQYGVPREEAMPEVSGPVEVYEVPGPLLDLITQVRAILPDGSREALFPRRVAWEREHRAYLRTRDGEPNPRYLPSAGDRAARAACRDSGPHDDGMHIEGCPDVLG